MSESRHRTTSFGLSSVGSKSDSGDEGERERLNKSLASLSMVDGGLEVDLGDTYLEIHGEGPLDINVRHHTDLSRSRSRSRSGSRSGSIHRSSASPHRNRSQERKRHMGTTTPVRKEEGEEEYNDMMFSELIEEAARDAASTFVKKTTREDGEDEFGDWGSSPKSHGFGADEKAFEERLARLEKLLEEDLGQEEDEQGGEDREETLEAKQPREQKYGNPVESPTSHSSNNSSKGSLEKQMDRLGRMLTGVDVEDDEDEGQQRSAQRPMDSQKDAAAPFSQERQTRRYEEDEADEEQLFQTRSPRTDTGMTRHSVVSLDQQDEWDKLNYELEKAGFNAIPLDNDGLPDFHGTSARSTGLFAEIRHILSQYERRGQVIEELTVDSTRTLNEDNRLAQKLSKTEHELARAKRELDLLRDKAKQLQEGFQITHKGDESQLRKLQRENAALQQKLSLSEHRVKAKEAVLERMQSKLESQWKRQETQSERLKDVFRDLEKRNPRPNSTADQKLFDVIQKFETEREERENENQLLQAQVRRLNEELRKKDNMLTGTKELDLETMEEELRVKSKRLEMDSRVSQDALEKREKALVQKFSKLEQKLQDTLTEKSQLEETIENLKLELSSRPTMRDWKDAKRQIAQLEAQVQTAVEALEDQEIEQAREHNIFIPKKRYLPAGERLSTREKVELMAKRAIAEKKDNAKRLSTAELIRRDKLNHRLGLDKVTSLPKSSAHELIQQVCRVLELSDVDLIVPALQKMCWIVQAMPRLESFVKQVTSFVSLHGDEFFLQKQQEQVWEQQSPSSSKKVVALMEAVLQQLKRWAGDIRQLHSVRTFRDHVRSELNKSVGLKERREDGEGIDANSLTDDQVLQVIRDLIELERTVMEGKEAFHAAENHVKEHPEILVNRCVRHFQQLFNVRSLDGVFPKLNELYVFTNEMENFLKVLRPTLGLSKASSVHACLAKVQELSLTSHDTHHVDREEIVERHNISDQQSPPSSRLDRFYLPQWE